jgi:putative addiction module component (TIGR02574 family)
MELSPDLIHQVFTLPAQDRYELAHQLLDSIDEKSAANLDEAFIAELRQRRDDMLRGDEIVEDWRASLSAIENCLSPEAQR